MFEIDQIDICAIILRAEEFLWYAYLSQASKYTHNDCFDVTNNNIKQARSKTLENPRGGIHRKSD